MRSGRFPSQEEALRRRIDELAEEKARARASRRMFLGLAVGGTLGACAGAGAVSVAGGEDPEPEEATAPIPLAPEHAWLVDLALGPKDALLRRAGTFLVTVAQAMPEEDRVWVGVARIAVAVVEKEPHLQPAARTALLVLARKLGFPDHMHGWVELVRSQSR